MRQLLVPHEKSYRTFGLRYNGVPEDFYFFFLNPARKQLFELEVASIHIECPSYNNGSCKII